MDSLIAPIVLSFTAFISTNIDDILLLTLFFAQVDDRSFRKEHIIVGQYLGFGMLLILSLVGFFTRFVVPLPWIGLLGFAPIVIGLRRLYRIMSQRKADPFQEVVEVPDQQEPPFFLRFFGPQTYTVAAVTLANGGDNLGIYIPMFASQNPEQVIIVIMSFLILVGVWCFIGYRLGTHPTIAKTISRYGDWIVPFVLISLGFFILIHSDSMSLLK